MQFTNPHTGEYRSVGTFTAFLGCLFFGPLYFCFKGLWAFGIIWGLLCCVGVGFLGWPIMPFLAAGMVRSRYSSRGFADTAGLEAARYVAAQQAQTPHPPAVV